MYYIKNHYMKSYLNLSQGFNPFNSHKNNTISFKDFIFSGGEPHIKLNNIDLNVVITCRIKSSDDLIKIAMAKDAIDALHNGYVRPVELFIPYFPGARQDRRMVKGEPLSVKIYADFINSLGFSKVTILDPHSEVTPALLNNVEVLENHHFVLETIKDIEQNPEDLYIISPDAGSNKKVKDLLKYLNNNINEFKQSEIADVDKTSEVKYFDLIKCDKTRDVRTGQITGFDVYAEDLQGKNCLIVDDICDGGGTFIGLAKQLKAKNAGKIYLFTTHGIFSKGFTDLKMFENIYSTDSFNFYNDLRGDHQVKTLKISL